MTTVVNIDYILLAVLLILTFSTCCYCVYRVLALQRSGQIEILLKPTRVLFSHKRDGESNEQLRTVVAYQNPFTGDYCVRKSRVGPKGYVNQLQVPESPDSGLSDEYEPLQLDPQVPQVDIPEGVFCDNPIVIGKENMSEKYGMSATLCNNSLNKTWNWNYKEYQI